MPWTSRKHHDLAAVSRLKAKTPIQPNAALALILMLAVLLSGCTLLRPKPRPVPKPFVPPPPMVRTIPDEPLIVGEPPPNPMLFADIASIPFPIFAPKLEVLPPPRVDRPKTRPNTTPTPPTEAVAEPTPPPVPVPKLTQILTDQEVRRYRGELDQSTRTAEQILQSALGRQLNQTQSSTANQVRTLLRQASEQRETDLVAARNLARRAEILARDLQRTLR